MTEIDNILQHIKEAETKGRELEIAPADRQQLTEQVRQYAEAFIQSMPEGKAYDKQGYDDPDWKAALSIDGQAHPSTEVLRVLKEKVDTPGINPASGGHLGYIPGGGIYASALGDFLADVTNRYAGVFYASPGAVRIENVLIDWVGKLVGYADGFGGNLTSGGSMANLIAISTARTVKKIQSREVEKAAIYLSRQTHHSVLKALRITGLNECIIREIAQDSLHRVDTDALEQQIIADRQEGLIPFMVIANAGSTDVGAIDPLEQISKIAKEHKLWFHVDGAYGGFFILTQEGKEKLKGMALADSVVLDPHKGLFIPYGLGMVIVKDVHHLLQANSYEANYMQDTQSYKQEYSPADLSPELSKHFRGLRMWLPLKLHGVEPFRACLEEKLWLTRYFHEKVQELGFEVGPYPELSVATYRYIPKQGDVNAFNQQLVKKVQDDGRIFISSTTINGKYLLRFACLSFRTHLRETDLLLTLLKQYVEELE